MNKININRSVLNVCSFCNLKCKHCLAFIPYYENPRMVRYDEAKEILANYFSVVDSVCHFTITGGEPLLNNDTLKILEEVSKYKKQITKSMDFVTNATLLIPEGILDFFERNQDWVRVVLSDYGPSLSKRIREIESDLNKRKITYRVSKFFGNDLYYNGWIDFSDHSLKWDTVQARDENASKCIHNMGKYFVINDGELHRCSRSFWRMKNGIIPRKKGEYVALLDKGLSLEEKRADLLSMINSSSSTSCAHCVGLRNDVERVIPAQQL